jgi:hypothetical protein
VAGQALQHALHVGHDGGAVVARQQRGELLAAPARQPVARRGVSSSSAADSRSTWSPVWWPKRSLICLKWSRSKSTGAAFRARGFGQLLGEQRLPALAVGQAGELVAELQRVQPRLAAGVLEQPRQAQRSSSTGCRPRTTSSRAFRNSSVAASCSAVATTISVGRASSRYSRRRRRIAEQLGAQHAHARLGRQGRAAGAGKHPQALRSQRRGGFVVVALVRQHPGDGRRFHARPPRPHHAG